MVCSQFQARRLNIESCVREDITSTKTSVHQRWEKRWLVCQREERNPNDMYAVTVKTNTTKTIQIKYNNDLSCVQLHFIINFILTEQKLAHGPVKFPARSISHFVMNIIMAKTGSTTKVNSAK